ncbi:hypothetical protein NQ315_000408 [Exocentrus adspersus]|uniref:Protein quiver n=1 Tax=Exocentrus adspersus TaxID=1586481 RepID=A0AAV8VMN4_9CUCU|nr:hypothetical protein NQ315_000408 [Exocentrus adspersus]
MCWSRACFWIFLASWFQACFSLECYTCSSQIGVPDVYNDCEYFRYAEWEHHKISQCIYEDSVCAKYIVDHSGLRWVHRSCQHHDICSVLSARYSNDMNMLLECDTCADGNLCNSAPLHVAGFLATSLVLLCGKFLV